MLPRVLLLIAVIIWGWTFVATKICLAYLSPLELMGLRMLISSPVLLGLIRLKGISLGSVRRERRLILGMGLFAVHFLIQITGLKYTSAANSGWIIAISPLVMAVLARLLLKEKLGRGTIGGITVASAGVVLLVSRGEFRELAWLSSVGDWLVLASAHTWALYTIATRDLSRAHPPLAVTFATVCPLGVGILIVMIFTSRAATFTNLSVEAVGALFFLGVLGTGLALWFWQEALAQVGATEAGIFLYIEPIATTALAVPYLGESFGAAVALGGAMVLPGVWMAQSRRR